MPETVKLDVLVVAAHPDDAEITSGGLLLKMARLGRRTGIVDLTEGEMGTHGDRHDRAREAAEAAQILGLALRRNLGMPDAAVEYHQPNKLKLAQVIRDTAPELVVLPHWEQRHPDHLACSRLGYDACFIAGLKKAPLTGEPHRPRKVLYASYYRNEDYSFLVDISAEFDRKLEAVAAYESQFGDARQLLERIRQGLSIRELSENRGKDVFSPGINIYDLLYARSRYLGQKAGVMFAEAYTVREKMLVDDPQKMPVNSI